MKNLIKRLLRRRGKVSFINSLGSHALILDVGCGNNSPYQVKCLLPNSKYVGIDIADYNQTKPNLADEYILANPKSFTKEIQKLTNKFDAVISSHNIEHCDDREGTLLAMLDSLKIGGRIYISFPCGDSINFPNRKGTLNYYDDETHKFLPPNYNNFMSLLMEKNFEIEFSTPKYKPFFLWIFGALFEPFFSLKQKTSSLTWAFYGFETIIWAKKLDQHRPAK